MRGNRYADECADRRTTRRTDSFAIKIALLARTKLRTKQLQTRTLPRHDSTVVHTLTCQSKYTARRSSLEYTI